MKTAETENKLSDVAEQLVKACRKYPGLDPRDVLEAIEDPQWDDASRTDDWRIHVSHEVRSVWGDLGVESRLVAYLLSALRAAFESP